MMQCRSCEGAIVSSLVESYDAELALGIPRVALLHSVVSRRCQSCDKDYGIEIPDVEGLQAAIGVAICMLPTKLSGAEIRFLRKAMKVKAAVLADYLQVSAETISRWENSKDPINPLAEKELRKHAGRRLHEQACAIPFDEKRIEGMNFRSLRLVQEPQYELAFCRVSLAEIENWGLGRKAT